MKVFSFPEPFLVKPGKVRQRCFLFCFFMLTSLCMQQSLQAQSAPLYFTPIPFSDPDIIAPGRGAEQWENGSESVNYPLADTIYRSLDVYCRFPWTRIEDSVAGKYNWEFFDGLIKEAIDRGQKLSFGIMPVYDGEGTTFYDGAKSAYPLYLHKTMQSGVATTRDWISNGVWIPNWNHSYYLSRLKALNIAINNHILTTSYKGVAFKNVIYCIDIRGYGNYGEWHNAGIVEHVSDYPAGRQPTATTLKAIISHHTTVYKDWPLTLMIATFDAGQYDAIMVPAEVTHFALTTKNAWGPLGWRRDQWGATDSYLDRLLKNNEKKYGNSEPFGELIKKRFLTSPVTGEPPRYINPGGPCDYWDLERQLTEYGATSLGNGNWGKKLTGCGADNARAAFKKAGYRLIIESGVISNVISPGRPFEVQLQWKNIGIAPTYEQWDVFYELKNDSNQVIWSQVSKFKPKLFAPAEDATVFTDNLTMASDIIPGRYSLNLVIRDPSGYRKPLPLAIKGRNEDGSYTLKQVIVSPVDCTAPVARIRAKQPCNDQPALLMLDSASGNGPYDLVVNGVAFNGINTGEQFAVLDEPVQSIWSDIPKASSYIDAPVELGLKFKATVDGSIKGIRFFSPHEPTGVYTGHFWTLSGQLIDSVRFDSIKPDSWHEAYFQKPVKIKADSIYLVSYHASGGHYASTPAGLKEPVANGSLAVAGETESGGNGVYSYGNSPTFPVHSFNASNYWVDVIFTPSRFTYNLTSITDNNGCNNAGELQSLTVNFSDSCSQPADTVAYSHKASLKATKACKGKFSVILDSITGVGPFNLVINGVSYEGISLGDTIFTNEEPVQSVWQTTPTAGSYIDAPVELGMKFIPLKTGRIKGVKFFSPVDPSGVYSGRLWSSGGQLLGAVTFTNVTPNNWQEALFTTPVTVFADSTYIVSYHGEGHYAATPGGLKDPLVSGYLQIPADSLSGGNGIYAYGPAGSFPTQSFHSANYWADVLFAPDSVYDYNFHLTKITDNNGVTTNGQLYTLAVQASHECDTAAHDDTPSAQLGYEPDCVTRSINLILDSADGIPPYDLVINGVLYRDVMPGETITKISPPAASIWNATSSIVSAEDQPVELGMKFTSSTNGYIRGIRFYSPDNAAGTYTGHLWSSAGIMLDSVVFSQVSPSGWQEAWFEKPVFILADSVYVASYHSSAGHYAATPGGLRSATTSGYLTALADSLSGGNGVYHYGPSGNFPDATYNGNNYWVDVLFVPDTGFQFTFDLTAITDQAGASKTGALQTLSINAAGCPEEKPSTQARTSQPTAMTTVQPSLKDYDADISNLLYQNKPNPVTGQTIIAYSLSKPGMVNMSIYDTYGRLIKILVHGWKDAGNHTVVFEKGVLHSGVYFYRMQTGSFSSVKKLIIQ